MAYPQVIAFLLSRLAVSVACGDIDTDACRALAEQLPDIDRASASLDAVSQLRLAALRTLIEEAAPAPTTTVKVASETTPVLMKTWGRQNVRGWGWRKNATEGVSTSEEKPLVAKTWGRQHIRVRTTASNDVPTTGKKIKEGCIPQAEVVAQNDPPVLMKTWGRQHIRSALFKKDTEEG